jgi:hypothetical protein
MERMAKYLQYSSARARQGAVALWAPIDLFIFTAGLFGSVALLLIALLMHI